MKKALSMILALALLLGVMPLALAEAPAFTEKEVPVVRSDKEGDTMVLRFYEDQPSVPYYGFAAYCNYVGNNPMTYVLNGDGTGTFTSAQGATAVADPKAGTLTTDRWVDFRNPPMPLQGTAIGLKDSTCGYVRVTDITYEGEAKSVTLDFAKYGLHMYVEKEDVYLPLTLISTIMGQVDTWNANWNGEKVYYGRFNPTATSDFLESGVMQARLAGKREEDLAKEVYAELCFIFDNFFGHPGVAALDQAIAEKGLEQALLSDERTAGAVKGLQSTDTQEYIAATLTAFYAGLDDGHTNPLRAAMLVGNNAPAEIQTLMLGTASVKKAVLQMVINQIRGQLWGAEPYHESGSTAVIRVDSFMPDEAAWEKFYKGEGDIPADCAGAIVSGLRKAAANPEIKNVIFDLTANTGGSSDVLALMTGLTTGSNKLYGIEKRTGQRLCATYETDNNLDGVFDEKDKEAVYTQFNYAVLTTQMAFSCGNLAPFMMQEGGAVLLGEPTGGGSCCIQVCTLSDGMDFVMSSSMWQLTDRDGASVEGGCHTDMKIDTEAMEVPVTPDGSVTMQVNNYMPFYNDAGLEQMMNEWFAAQEKPAA